MEEPGYTHPLGHSHTLSVDLGPRFDLRWKGASLRLRRELMAELHSIYRSLEEHEMVVLERLPPRPYMLLAESPLMGFVYATPPAPSGTETASTDPPAAATGKTSLPRAPGHTLPPGSLLNRLLRGQVLAEDRLRELMEAPPTPPEDPETEDMEQELRQRMGPIIDILIEEHIQGLKAELRFRLRAELESIVSATVKKP